MPVQLINPITKRPMQVRNDGLVDPDGHKFPLVGGAYRFVDDNNYTSNFGYQWNKFQKTQIDREQKNSSQSTERFFAATGWDKQDLSGQNVLEVGSGAGRFSQVVLEHTSANLYSVDYSNAVEANFKNNGPHERLHLFQASIYELPFPENTFDKVFCFGVLQHTPDFKKSVESLVKMAKPGGEVIVDFYPINGWHTKVHSKYMLRPITKRMSNTKLLSMIDNNADRMIAAQKFFNKLGVGKLINRFIPICDIKNTLPPDLTDEELREWVVLDTFDMFSPEYDNPQRKELVGAWFEEFGMKNVEAKVIQFGANNNSVTIVRGIKRY
jgi:ubiquinone/menaquinone biosynthesis C-methylase UbiE